MHEISVILIDYAVDKKQAGTIDPGHRRIELKMAGFGLFQGAVYQIMQLQKLVNMFGGDLTRRYGQRCIS